MSWIRGNASDYLDLSDVLVAAATGNSLQTVDSISAAGSGYVVGEIITFTGGTFSVATQLEVTSVGGSGDVTGVRIYNAGIYTVNPSDSNATTASASGTGATFTHTYAANGWAVDRNTTWSGSEKEVIMHGSGGGSDAIYVGWRTLSGSGYYNFELHGFTGYDSGLDHDEQPGASPGFHDATLDTGKHGCYLLCLNSTVSYWININSYRIILVIKVGSAYFNAYLGFGNRFGTVSEYPYPLCIAGHTSQPLDPYTQTKLSSGLVDPWADNSYNGNGPMVVMNTDNQWYQVKNGDVSISSRTARRDVCVTPAQTPAGTNDNSIPPEDKFCNGGSGAAPFSDIINQTSLGGSPTINTETVPGTTNAHILLPATIVMFTPSIQILMELDEVYWCSGFNIVTEDRIIIGSTVYRVFQNCNRTDTYAYLAVREAS